ncbi:hypothetical protein TPA0907_40140 [Micromonospora humidisoli]|nr:hypothetical protein TPA0907_40140 [Micromonospora sp. AKA109]
MTTAGPLVSTHTVARVPTTRRSNGPMSRRGSGMGGTSEEKTVHLCYPAGGWVTPGSGERTRSSPGSGGREWDAVVGI